MARPSKLTPAQWEEIERRLMLGEGVRDLAREFVISPGQISKRFPNKGNKAVIEVAAKLAEAHTALAALPVPHQGNAWSMSMELRGLTVDVIGSARYGAKNSLRLNALANSELQKIDDSDPLASQDALKGVAVLTRMANEAAQIPIGLISANKDRIRADEEGEAVELDQVVQYQLPQNGR